MGIRAVGSRIIIEAAKEADLETTEGGIILQKTAVKIQTSGKILSMGGAVEILLDDGDKIKVGDMVEFHGYAPQTFKYKEEKYLTITDDDVICKIEEDK